MPNIPSEKNILSVKQLNVLAKDVIEGSFPNVLVEGEISNLAQPSSGHAYFTLKDSSAQVKVALFAGQKRRLSFTLANGQKVIVQGNLSIFGARGDYQLIAKQVEASGEGALRREFEALKQKLEARGWFDPAQKQALPKICYHLALITSPSGAAVRDIIHVLERRFPLMQVTVFPSLVQGKEASEQLCQSIQTIHKQHNSQDPENAFDLILIARGGGSLEDLWPFNEEKLAEAIHSSELPIISGVGHETDYTICDLVADYRAPTPSAAAETLSPDQEALQQQLNRHLSSLKDTMRLKLRNAQQTLRHLEKRNINPQRQLQDQAQKLDFLTQNLHKALRIKLQALSYHTNQQQTHLQAHNPKHALKNMQEKHLHIQKSLQHALQQTINNKLIQPQRHVNNLAKRLNSVSPLNTLDRGYSITRVVNQQGRETNNTSTSKQLINEKVKLKNGDMIHTELNNRIIESRVTNVLQKSDS